MGIVGDIRHFLPPFTRFLERVGFPAVMVFVVLFLATWGFQLGIKALNKNTAALSSVQTAVDNNTLVLKRVFEK